MAGNCNAYDLVQWYWGLPVQDSSDVSINKYLINYPSPALQAKQTNISNLSAAAVAS